MMSKNLTETDKKKVIQLLQAGKPLPAKYLSLLFGKEQSEKMEKKADIADQKHKQATIDLREHSQFIESIINLSPGVIYIYDIVTRCNVYINDGVQKVLGYSASEISGMGDNVIQALMHPDDYEGYVETILPRYAAAPDNFSILHQYRMKSKAGKWCWVDSNEIIYNRLADGSPCQILGIIHDITDRKQAEENLVDSEVKFRTVVEQSPVAIEIYAPTGEILTVNDAWSKFWGLEKDAVSGFNILQDPECERTGLTAAFKEAQKGRTRVLSEMCYDAEESGLEGGKKRWITARMYPIKNPEGRVKNIVLTYDDITERKQAGQREKDLHVKLADSKRRESLGVLAGGVAHDLNNILGPIVLLPEMVREILEDPASMTDKEFVEVREDLSVIEGAARRAVDVIKDLKALGRRGHVDLEPLDANMLVRDCLGTNDVEALREDYSDVRIDSNLSRKKMVVSVDKTDLHRVLLNLVVNAVEAISGRGNVGVDVESVVLSRRKLGYEPIEPGSYVVIHVRDTGEGITDEVLKRMFEPFITTKKACVGRSGSGLGLSVVHSIMKDHNGYVDVEGGTKKWSTTFSLYFPAVDEASSQDVSGEQEEALLGGSEHILVIDDEQVQRFIANRCLRKLGYKVTEVADGHEAIKLFEKSGKEDGSAFDLVLLDMILEEGFDGLDTYNEFLKHCPAQKVLVVSGQAESTRVNAAMGLGASWLAKPYDNKELADAVRMKLDAES